jgi:YbbR domain-containing protein
MIDIKNYLFLGDIQMYKLVFVIFAMILFSSCSEDELHFENEKVSINITTHGGQATVSKYHKFVCYDKNNDYRFATRIYISGELSGIKLEGENQYTVYFENWTIRTAKIDFNSHYIYECYNGKEVLE